MHANSLSVSTDQCGIHPRLEEVVRRHLLSAWQGSPARHTVQAFRECEHWRQQQGRARPLVLDSGCGTGRSSLQLALAQPEALILGIDRSAVRLQRLANQGTDLPPNLMLVRAECADFWRLAAQAGWKLSKHCLLYPNPWPKAAHLKRRWHGHPVFPQLLGLGGALELRSNWLLYLEEMKSSLTIAGHRARVRELDSGRMPETDFQRKYRDSGQSLWILEANLAD